MNFRIFLLSIAFLFFISCSDEDNATNTKPEGIPSTQIGFQTWMLKNLDVSVYRNGDSIPQVSDPEQWYNLTTGAWCYYQNAPENGKIFGKLYNWFAVNDPRGLAPEGWHVASDDEWKEMEIFMGLSQTNADKEGFRGTNDGGKFKTIDSLESGKGLWHSPNTAANNQSTFSGLPGGYRQYDGTFFGLYYNGCWWTATEKTDTNGYYRALHSSRGGIGRANAMKQTGYSVRCIKDK